jgi:DNA-binding MarR family transcriptional regulator
VASLETRALVGRARHPLQGRILQTSLTERGRSLLAAAHQRVRAIEARMVAELSEQERHELVRLLGACARALNTTGSADHAQHQATHIPPGGPDTRQESGSPL